jgi:hypothetical protein
MFSPAAANQAATESSTAVGSRNVARLPISRAGSNDRCNTIWLPFASVMLSNASLKYATPSLSAAGFASLTACEESMSERQPPGQHLAHQDAGRANCIYDNDGQHYSICTPHAKEYEFRRGDQELKECDDHDRQPGFATNFGPSSTGALRRLTANPAIDAGVQHVER